MPWLACELGALLPSHPAALALLTVASSRYHHGINTEKHGVQVAAEDTAKEQETQKEDPPAQPAQVPEVQEAPAQTQEAQQQEAQPAEVQQEAQEQQQRIPQQGATEEVPEEEEDVVIVSEEPAPLQPPVTKPDAGAVNPAVQGASTPATAPALASASSPVKVLKEEAPEAAAGGDVALAAATNGTSVPVETKPSEPAEAETASGAQQAAAEVPSQSKSTADAAGPGDAGGAAAANTKPDEWELMAVPESWRPVPCLEVQAPLGTSEDELRAAVAPALSQAGLTLTSIHFEPLPSAARRRVACVRMAPPELPWKVDPEKVELLQNGKRSNASGSVLGIADKALQAIAGARVTMGGDRLLMHAGFLMCVPPLRRVCASAPCLWPASCNGHALNRHLRRSDVLCDSCPREPSNASALQLLHCGTSRGHCMVQDGR